MGTYETSLENLENMILKSLSAALKERVKAKLLADVDSILEDMATEIADNIALSIHTMRDLTDFGGGTKVVVALNLKDPRTRIESEVVHTKIVAPDIIKR